MTSQDLTTLKEFPEEEYLQPFEQIPDIEEVNSNVDDDNSGISFPESSSYDSAITTENSAISGG